MSDITVINTNAEVIKILTDARISPERLKVPPDRPELNTAHIRLQNSTHWVIVLVYVGFKEERDNGYQAVKIPKGWFSEPEAEQIFQTIIEDATNRLHISIPRVNLTNQ